MVCMLAAPWVHLSVSMGNGWSHNALRHHWHMPISCHFRDCKALLVMSLTHVNGAMASVKTLSRPMRHSTVYAALWREKLNLLNKQCFCQNNKIFCGIKSYNTCSNAVFRHWHWPTIVLPLVYCPVDVRNQPINPLFRCVKSLLLLWKPRSWF